MEAKGEYFRPSRDDDAINMIIICELICDGVSHEKVNSGFVYGLSLAFPSEKIRFYASESHANAIRNILEHDGIKIQNIEYIHLAKPFSNYISLYRIFNDVVRCDADKVFFLSFDPKILLAIKILKKIGKFRLLKFALVLHGGFESIANHPTDASPLVLPRMSIPSENSEGLIDKLKRLSVIDVLRLVVRKLKNLVQQLFSSINLPTFFTYKRILSLWNSVDYRYIALSPHIILNAEKYINTNKIELRLVVMPTRFLQAKDFIRNDYVKFAIFGFGDSLVLHNIAHMLSERGTTNKYLIKIIGMDDRGVKGFKNIEPASKGRLLDRATMEKLASDVDLFMILYDKNRYRLSCSGSIIEALSMVKPVIHFDNECINQFNSELLPIGFKCSTLDEYIDQLVDIIENYGSYHEKLNVFRRNILELRERYSIESSVTNIRASFTWVKAK